MNQDTTVTVKDYVLHVGAGLIICVLLVASFGLGMVYQKINSRFQYHEIPVVGGGTALVIPKEWSVIPAWNKFGRPHIDTDRECETVKEGK